MKKYDIITLGLAAAAATGAMLLASPDADANPGDTETDPSWSCVLDGNHVCGPNNAMGAVPGLYSDDGRLIQLWPTIRNCVVLPGHLLDSCDDSYIDPQFVKLTNLHLTYTRSVSE